MLETVAVVLVLLWALGLVGGYALGGFIHVLLVLALVVVIVREKKFFLNLTHAHDHHDQRQDEQNMDEAPERVTANQAERPQENQDYRDGFQHVCASFNR